MVAGTRQCMQPGAILFFFEKKTDYKDPCIFFTVSGILSLLCFSRIPVKAINAEFSTKFSHVDWDYSRAVIAITSFRFIQTYIGN